MAQIIEVDEQGILHLPPELLGDTPLPTRFVADKQGDRLILVPAETVLPTQYVVKEQDGRLILVPDETASPSMWMTRTPAERAAAWLDWVARLPPGPGLSDEAVSRESMYD